MTSWAVPSPAPHYFLHAVPVGMASTLTQSLWLFIFALIWFASPCYSQYDCRTHPDAPILCLENQFSTSISNCSGEASVCEAVSSNDLTLNCSSCSSAKEVLWKLGTSHLLPYNISVAQIPAEDVQPGATGCYTCVCGDKSYSFSVDIRAADCPHLVVRNETVDDKVYLYPQTVQTELNATSKGVLTVNCTSRGWPTPKITWSVYVSSNISSIYDFPYYNVTENGQVLSIFFPTLQEIDRSVTYYCLVHNVVGRVSAQQGINIQAFYNYFLKPHECQSHGSVAVPDGQEGVAYCAVNPEDGVDIGYTVCAYHGEETDLDWIASPFIANGSSDCCLCGMCGGEVLGPGVTANLDPSPPNSNNFHVLACKVSSKTAVDSSFVCLAHRETGVQASTKQALALFHFQPPRVLPPQPFIPFPVSVGAIVIVVLLCLIMIPCLFICALCKCKEKCSGSSSGYGSTLKHGGRGNKSANGLKQNPNGTNSVSLAEVQVPFDMEHISDFLPDMASQWSAIGYKLSLCTEVSLWISRQERNDEKCGIIINAAIDQRKLTSWQELFAVLESDAVGLHNVVCSIREKYCQPQIDVTDSRSTTNDDELMLPQ